MQLIFWLAGPSLSIAEAEVKSLITAKSFKRYLPFLLAEKSNLKDNKILSRFAFVHQTSQVLFSCTVKNLRQCIDSYDWNSVYHKDFSLRIINPLHLSLPFTESGLADKVYAKLKKPKANLTNPITRFEFIVSKNRIFACIHLLTNDCNFKIRNVHLRPAFYPGSLDARIARVSINLTGIRKGVIFDPFCGSGTILIEAGLCGLAVKGSDISGAAVASTKINLRHYGINSFSVFKKDATTIKRRYNYVATQLPFGLSVKLSEKQLYEKFIKTLSKILINRAVIIFPGFFSYRKIINKYHLRIASEHTVFINDNLTRKIVVIEK